MKLNANWRVPAFGQICVSNSDDEEDRRNHEIAEKESTLINLIGSEACWRELPHGSFQGRDAFRCPDGRRVTNMTEEFSEISEGLAVFWSVLPQNVLRVDAIAR
jgi:hypothetical protein